MEIELEWTSHPNNPLISPVWPERLIGDPVVLDADKSPDGIWHMFLNTILWIYHYTSKDGIKWNRNQRVCHGIRAFIFEENSMYYLFYEMNYTPGWSVIMVRRSFDLKNWSKPKKILSPELTWEKVRSKVSSCPCIVKDGNIYRLYYSTSQVFLPDLGFSEPLYIGIAESDNVMGPYKKRKTPIIVPMPEHTYRNLGAGAIKVYRDHENRRWLGFNNGIYNDRQGRSRSAIMVMISDDGINWSEPFDKPIITPTNGWKKALVYQLCIVERDRGEIWLYYNSRDNWRGGVERIGLEIGKPCTRKS